MRMNQSIRYPIWDSYQHDIGVKECALTYDGSLRGIAGSTRHNRGLANSDANQRQPDRTE